MKKTYILMMGSSTNWNDINILVKKSLSGDKDAYRDFLNQVSTYLVNKINRTLPESQREDIHQEVLLAIHKSLPTLDTSRSCKPWINAIAHYKVSDCLRGIYKDSNLNYGESDELISEDKDQVETEQYIQHITAPLNSNEKEILLLLKYKGHSVDEVSKMTGNSTSNIKVISFRAIKKIREFIKNEEFHE